MNNFLLSIFMFLASALILGCSSSTAPSTNEQKPPVAPVLINNDSLEYLATLPNGRIVSMRMFATNPKDMQVERPPQPVTIRYSDDHGLSWSGRDTAFSYAPGKGVVYGGFVFSDKTGNLHCFGVRYFRLADKDQPGHAILLHNRSGDGGKTWTASKEVDFGHSYTGSFNTVTQLDNGRIILALSYTTEYLEERAERDFQIVTVHSDDLGDTWHIGSDDITVPPGEFIGHPGALEPVMIQLKDQRVWMIIRTQQGRFFQSFSSDHGETWSSSSPTDFKAPNAPGGIIRLRDGRLVFCWNDLSQYPELTGNQRQYLHVAISNDDGKTWSSSREIARRRDGDKPDTNVGYPYMTTTADNHLLISYHRVGNREGVTWWQPIVEVVRVDPDWIAYDPGPK
ncbi:MAG: exo-alpha-sialidase [Saprospiraceae bacterium]|nr:exo-alpha-sialidase [Saprospiraceae bacterium]